MGAQIIEKLDKEAFIKYLSGLVNAIPEWVYVLLASSFLIGVILFIWKGVKKGLLLSVLLFLFDYIFLLICSTVVFRQYAERKPFELRIFWSYDRAIHGEPYLLYENIMNIVVFVPIGLVLCSLMPLSKWWATLIIGFCFSVVIELIQLFFKRGLFELDDIIHNTAGCIFGLLIAMSIKISVQFLTSLTLKRISS